MSENEPKHEQFLKRAQLWIAVLVGVISLAIGVYNFKNIFFSKKGPGKVTLEVRSEADQPIASASVNVLKVQGGIVATSQTDSAGKYERRLEPGNYSLKVDKTGFLPETLFFSIDPAETTDLNMKLKAMAGASSNAIRSAMEEVGASWIKQIASPKTKSQEKTQTESAVPAN